MRRSTLQRKDRDELTEIAAALGRKPPSRARKGEKCGNTHQPWE